MRVIAHDPYMAAEDVTARRAGPVSLGALIEHSDYLVIPAPLTKETRHRIGEGELRRMKPTLILVRPSSTTLPCTWRWREAGSPRLPWTTSRRNPPSSGTGNRKTPLFSLDDVIITPHAAYAWRPACLFPPLGAPP